MKFKWEVDAETFVEAHISGFGKEAVFVNDREVVNQRRWRTKGLVPVPLPGGRMATLGVASQFGGRPSVDLRVDGQLIADIGKEPFKCGACSVIVKPYDRFCDACGAVLPSAEQRKQKRQLKEATGAMRALAWLFAIFGVIMFFLTKSQASNALTQLAQMDDGATVPINGITYTVAQLRD